MDISGTNLQGIALISPGVPDTTGPLLLRTGRNGATNYVGGPAADSFIITTGNSIAVSINSITSGNVWANAVLGNSTTVYGSAAYGNGTYVLLPSAATAPSPNAAISTDGFNWQSSPAPGLGANRGGAITYGDKFVRLMGSFEGPTDIAWYSDDGTNWTQSNVGLVALWKDVAYGNGRYVALSDRNSSFDPQTQAVTSADGISWTTVSMPAAARWTSVTYANNRFVAIGNDSNRAAYSTDGNTWSGATLPANTAWLDVAYGNGTFLAVAFNGNTAWSRDNGETWANGLPNGSISPWNGNSVFGSSLDGGSNVLVLLQSFQAPPTVFYSTDGGNTWANVYRETLPF